MTERRQVTPAGVLFRSHGPSHRKIRAGIVGLTDWEILRRGAGASRECRFLYSRDFACVEFREGEALPA
ncbi:MAG: hypothetical protein IJI36_06910, partial [Kiritimatiellae bacterium]|nr:hypothetical protein [Kiritimatiellia bacterium]